MKSISSVLSFIILLSVALVAEKAGADRSPGRFADEVTSVQRIAELRDTVEAHVKAHGDYSAKLYAPLRQLGLLLQASGEFDAAVDTFRRMQHLVHRIHGVYDPRQLESVDHIIDTYYLYGDPLALDTQQHFRFRVAEKSFRPDSREYVLAQLQLADWYRNSGRLNKASRLYADMLATRELQPELRVRLLRAEAMTRYLAGWSGATERLHEALRLTKSGDASLVEPSQALVDYMDMAFMEQDNVAISRSGLAPAFLGFQKPHDVLELITFMDEPREPSSETYVNFGTREPDDPAVPTVGYPVAMCGNTFDSLVGHDRSPEFEVSVVIDDEGRPADISVKGDGPIRLKRYLKTSLKSGKFRPATNPQGEFTTTTLSFRQTFGEVTGGVGSLSSVQDWSKMLVAQTCQVSSIQRI